MRLQKLTPDELDDQQQALYAAIVESRPQNARFLVEDDGSLRGPFNALLHHPPVGHTVSDLGAAVRFSGVLPDQARELVIMTVAAHWKCEFEWWAHSRLGQAAGLTDEQVEAVRTGTDPALDDPVARAAVHAARALVERGDLDDDEFATATDALGATALVEITALVGYYAMLAMQMRVYRVPGFPGTEPAFG